MCVLCECMCPLLTKGSETASPGCHQASGRLCLPGTNSPREREMKSVSKREREREREVAKLTNGAG